MSASPPVEEPSAGAPRPRRRRIGRPLLLFLLLVLAVATLVRTRLDDWVRTRLEQRLSETLDADVRIGSLRLTLHRLAVDFRDVRLEGHGPEAPIESVVVDSGRLRLRIGTLSAVPAGRLHLAEVLLDGAACRLRGPLPQGAAADDPLWGSLDVVVDRLSVTRGSIGYDDHVLPLDFTGTALEIDAAWGRSTLIGNIAFDYSVLTPPLSRRLELDVSSGFRWRTGTLDLVRFHAVGGGLDVVLDSEILWQAEREVRSVGRMTADLDRLGELLPAGSPVLAGNVTAAFQLESLGGPPDVRGHFESGPATLGILRVDALEGDARFDSGRLELTHLDARAFAGRVRGTATVEITERLRFETELQGTGLEALRVLEFVDVPLPLGGRVDARVSASGDPEHTATWSGRGEFTLVGDRTDPALLPARGRGELVLTPGLLVLHAQPVHIAATDLSVDAEIAVGGSGRRGGEVRLRGTVPDAAETQRGTLRVLEALAVEIPDVLAEPLFGSGSAVARVGLGDTADFDVTLDLVSGALGDRPFNRLQLTASVLDDVLRIERLDVADERQRLTGTTELTLTPLGIVALDAVAVDLDTRWITERIPSPPALVGRISGSLAIERGAGGINGTGALTLTEGRLAGERFESASGHLKFEEGVLRVSEVVVRGPAGEVSGSATVHLESARAELALDHAVVDLGRVSFLSRIELPLEGTLELSGALAFDDSGAGSGDLDIVGRDCKLQDFALGSVEGRVDLRADGFDVRLRESSQDTWEARARVGAAGEWPIDGTLRIAGLAVGDASNASRPVAAILTGEFAYAGPLATPTEIRVDGTLDRARLDIGTKSLRGAEPIRIRVGSGRVEAAPIHLTGPGSDVAAQVVYDLDGDRWDAALTGRLEFGLLAALVPELRASGEARVDLRLGGSLERPALQGWVTLDQGRLRWSEFPETFEQIELELRVEGDRAVARNLRALVGGGEMAGTGEVLLAGVTPTSFSATLDVAHVRLAIPEGFAGVYEGSLQIDGNTEQVSLTARADLLRGLYDEPFDFGGLLGFGARELTSATGPDAGYPVFLNLDVIADGDVWLRNDLAEVETAVDLNIGGTVARPEVTGQITSLEGGKLVFRDVDYRIESAGLQFVERERLNPYLSLQARTNVRAYEIVLRVEGTQDDFRYELTSNPSLSSQDIIALLTTGHTLEDLTASQRDPARTSYTGDVAANYFAGALTGRFEKQLQRILGLERVRIDPLLVEGESDPTTRITIGKEVADDLFVILSSDVGDTERQIYQIEWQASPQIRLTAERDELGSLGGDIQYTDRFRLRRRPAAEGPVQGSGAALPPEQAKGTVTYLTLEGVPEDEARSLIRRLPLTVGGPFTRSSLFDGLQALRRAYVRDGRIETRIRTAVHEDPDSGEVAVSYIVQPGAKVVVRFEGVKEKDERRLRQRLEDVWTDSLFAEDLYGDSVREIQRFFQERGYYAVDVAHERVEADGVSQLLFTIDRGRPVTVESVEVVGAAAVGAERVKRQMSTREPSFLARKQLDPEVLEEDLRAIRNLYWDLGYLEVRVHPARIRLSASSDRADVTVEISEGPRFEIAAIEVPSDVPFDEASMLDWCGLVPGQTFSPHRLVEAEGRLRAGIDEQGYADARVRARFELDDGLARVFFEVEQGEIKRVGEIAIHGNRVTKRKIIAREIDLKEGDAISRAALLKIQHRLYGLGIFRSVRVGYRSLEGDPSRQLLEVHVDEAAPIGLSVGGGYENEGDARVRLSLTHDNLAGRDRAVGLHARASSLVRRFQLTAEDRHLFGSGTPGLLSLGLEEREETAFTLNRRSIAVRADRRRGPKWSGFLRYSFQRVDLRDVTDALAAREDKLDNIRLGDLGVVFLRDTRDDPFLTRSGSLFSAETHVFDKAFVSDASFVKSTLTGAYVHTFRNGTAIASVSRLGLARPFGGTRQVPLSERFFAGGDSTLRGFSRDGVGPRQDGLPFGGEALFLVNQEFLFPLWQPLKAVMFVDIGNVYEDISSLDLSDLREVAGTGLRLETPIGPLRLEYGWKLDRLPDESRGEWVLAIGMAF